MTTPADLQQGQRGASLIIVMVVMLMCALLALGAARNGILQESMVGNLSDEQRAFLAAEALMRDAQLDIQSPDKRSGADGDVYYPVHPAADMTALQALALVPQPSGAVVPCRKGLCFPATTDTLNAGGTGNWWQQSKAKIAEMRAVGASFGTVTGAASSTSDEQPGNPLLQPTGDRLAHYWIEVFLHSPDTASMAGSVPVDQPYVYRITVVVDGLKAGTRVVLQSVMTP